MAAQVAAKYMGLGRPVASGLQQKCCLRPLRTFSQPSLLRQHLHRKLASFRKPVGVRASQGGSLGGQWRGPGRNTPGPTQAAKGEALSNPSASSPARAGVKDQRQLEAVTCGVAALVGIERALAAGLLAAGLRVSSPVVLLGALSIAMAVADAGSSQMYNVFEPALKFFDKWLAMFFVPSVVGIAVAPVPTMVDLIKVCLVTVASYLYTIWLSAAMVTSIQRWQRGGRVSGTSRDSKRLDELKDATFGTLKNLAEGGAKSLAQQALKKQDRAVKKAAIAGARLLEDLADKVSENIPPKLPPPPPPSVAARYVAGGLLLAPFVLVPSTRANPVLLAPGLLCWTTAIYLEGTRLPAEVKSWVSPTVFAGLLMMGVLAAYGQLVLGAWKNGINAYGKGAGYCLTLLIGPAVASLGFKVHTQRELLRNSMLQLLAVCFLVAPSNMLLIALMGRGIGLPYEITLAALSMTTTLGLALEMASIVGANKALATEGVTACGTLGLNTARKLLDSWKVTDPVARGVSVAASSHALGTSTLMNTEPDAAAVAGLTFAFKGALSVILVSIPTFRRVLMSIAGAPI